MNAAVLRDVLIRLNALSSSIPARKHLLHCWSKDDVSCILVDLNRSVASLWPSASRAEQEDWLSAVEQFIPKLKRLSDAYRTAGASFAEVAWPALELSAPAMNANGTQPPSAAPGTGDQAAAAATAAAAAASAAANAATSGPAGGTQGPGSAAAPLKKILTKDQSGALVPMARQEAYMKAQASLAAMLVEVDKLDSVPLTAGLALRLRTALGRL